MGSDAAHDHTRVIVLCGGSPHAHDFDDIRAALVSVLGDSGREVISIAHPDRLSAALDDGGLARDVIVVHGLWWRMLGEAYAPWRDDHAYVTSDEVKRAFTAHVHGGGSLLALHTAPVCFDDWPGWADIVGAGWVWGTSFHPPPAKVSCSVTAHSITAGIDDGFYLTDEIYGDLAMSISGDVLVRAKRSVDDDLQPIVWTHEFGAGRVVGDLLGHDGASITDPSHRRLILNAVDWLAAPRAVSETTGAVSPNRVPH